MSDIAINDATPVKTESEKPVQDNEVVKFPPFPDPTDDDFDDDITEEEKNYYMLKFPDLNDVKTYRLHCTACDRHLGCAARNESRMRSHPMLRTLMCNTCHTFYNSGEFEKGEDGSELYCRWCGQGGQVYCCSDCPHVFCARCIKRNLGMPKIKEIENMDDWKCFKCVPRCLWDLRALCWALLRFCDVKNKLTYSTTDLKLREAYQRSCALDDAECCKNKSNKRKSRDDNKRTTKIEKVDVDSDKKKEKMTSDAISKIPPTIQVKKFASINLDDSPKRAQKRPASPKNKIVKNPGAHPNAKMYSSVPILSKKMKLLANNPQLNPNRFPLNPNVAYIPKLRPAKPPPPPSFRMPSMVMNGLNNTGTYNNMYRAPSSFNNTGFPGMGNMVSADNINLSLEELTQGLDLAAVAAMAESQNSGGNDVVCTPDFPLEPLCEVTEDNTDEDVECVSAPKKVTKVNPPPLRTRTTNAIPDLSPENIVQMTDNDVTVNPATGGLKFRVDPQTLSSNKMYRLPDGRIFSINSNPQMPGGYSATIVAVSDNNKTTKAPPKGATYAARLSAVVPALQTKPAVSKPTPRPAMVKVTSKPTKDKQPKGSRDCNLSVPIEWYRYNLVDAVDALEYSLSRLQKLKKEATTMFLRTRTVDEMRHLHKVLDRVLNTSATRFCEVQANLNKGFKSFINAKKEDKTEYISDDDDDDVEILNVTNNDPIFIDENSNDSIESLPNKTQEVDLTGQGSEQNDSTEKVPDQSIGTDNDLNTVDQNGPDNIDSSKSENGNVDGDQIVSSTATDETKDAVDSHQKPEENLLNEDSEMTDEIDKSPKAKDTEDNVVEDVNDVEMSNDVDKSLKESNIGTPEPDADINKPAEPNDNAKETLLHDNSDDKVKQSDSIENSGTVTPGALSHDSRDTELLEDKTQDTEVLEDKTQDTELLEDKTQDTELLEGKTEDTEMTEDMIDDLLNDHLGDVGENLNLLDIPDLQEP